jgi:hypothetical protein
MVFIKKLGLSAVPRLIESNRCDDKHCFGGAATTEAMLVSGFGSLVSGLWFRVFGNAGLSP